MYIGGDYTGQIYILKVLFNNKGRDKAFGGQKMKEINDYINRLNIGTIKKYKNMAVAPLLEADSKLEYLVFDEAVNSGLRVSETGSVPTLHFSNKTGKEVLILQGEYAEGGKQNRMVAANVYMAKDFDGDVPVRCVEEHRWGTGYDSPNIGLNLEDSFRPGFRNSPRQQRPSGEQLYSSRRMATKGVCFASARGQGAVWSQVSKLMGDHKVSSRTGNISDVFNQKQDDLSDYVSNFHYTSGAVGIVVAIEQDGKKRYGTDIFDQSRTMEKNFSKLLESYILEAISKGSSIKQTKKEVKAFLDNINNISFNERKAISLGRDFLLKGNQSEGSALVYESIPVYVSFSTRTEGPKRDTPPRFGMDTGMMGHIRTGLHRRFR